MHPSPDAPLTLIARPNAATVAGAALTHPPVRSVERYILLHVFAFLYVALHLWLMTKETYFPTQTTTVTSLHSAFIPLAIIISISCRILRFRYARHYLIPHLNARLKGYYSPGRRLEDGEGGVLLMFVLMLNNHVIVSPIASCIPCFVITTDL